MNVGFTNIGHFALGFAGFEGRDEVKPSFDGERWVLSGHVIEFKRRFERIHVEDVCVHAATTSPIAW